MSNDRETREYGSVGDRGSLSEPPRSAGVATIALSEDLNPSVMAEDVAEDMTLAMLDRVLDSRSQYGTREGARENQQELIKLRAKTEQLEAELASARSELEFAGLKEEELETRNAQAQLTIEGFNKLSDGPASKDAGPDAKVELEEALARSRQQAVALQQELESSRAEVAQLRQQRQEAAHQSAMMGSSDSRERHAKEVQVWENECRGLRERVSELEMELSRKDQQLSIDMTHESAEDAPLLAAAYQQISVLNTQLAHLYTELTLARTESQRLQSVAADQAQQAGGTGGANSFLNGSAQSQGEMSAAPTQADLQKQGQQIADLVSDIRHLQLDLEYHQQKLDQMIEEKQQMLKDEKKMKMELAEAKKQVEEREQLIRHRDVDIQGLRDEAARWGGGGASGGGAGGGGFSGADAEATVSALRSEAAAKDSALIVSHYELHKEKLMRDRLEQKNLKLMDRMQKLMMVDETMRKDNVALERNLTSKERAFEEKDLQLRQVSTKSKQWQKQARAAQGRQKPVSLELEATPSQGLPLLGASQDGQLRSGRSTPTRTPRGGAPPQSPYGSR